MAETISKQQAAAALRTLADRIESGAVISSDEFVAAGTAARVAYTFGALPADTIVRSVFDEMSAVARDRFLKNGGKVIDAQ